MKLLIFKIQKYHNKLMDRQSYHSYHLLMPRNDNGTDQDWCATHSQEPLALGSQQLYR